MRNYQICRRFIMDTSDSDICFDKYGVCNHCKRYYERAQKELYYDEIGQQKLNRVVRKIKEDGKNNKYDCIIGLSGGVDSTMAAYMVKKQGLRPLGIHLDNGWNSDIAEDNINRTVKKLNIDLQRHKVVWNEFKDLQMSFLKASIPNCEIPTDHAIVALLFQTAAKKNIRYIISGSNLATEAIMPTSWGHDPKDLKYIKSIHKTFGKVKLKSFYHLSLFGWVYYALVKGIRIIRILNYTPYDKKNTIQFLEKELDWKNYGGKHYESVYTRFFQSYILPTKFSIDKRRAHLSNLICSSQMTREEALEEMERDIYPAGQLKEDKDCVIRKLGLTEVEFEELMRCPIKIFKDYPNDYILFSRLKFFVNLAKKIVLRNY